MCLSHAILCLSVTSFHFSTIMSHYAVTEDQDSSTDDKNWAVVPYDLTQNMVFPLFSEKTRRFKFDGIENEIIISQNWDGQGVSAVVWEAAIELTKYLAKNEDMKGKDILELGAGTGLVGIACGKLGANVTVTDLREALPFLSKNIELNFQNDDDLAPQVKELKWGQNLHHFHHQKYDFIIAADVIYMEDTFTDLLDTICYLVGCKGHESVSDDYKIVNEVLPTVFLSAKMRYSREEKFINQMKKYFNVSLVFSDNDAKIHIYKAISL